MTTSRMGRGYSKGQRGTLKAHLEAQYLRGYGGPHSERRGRKAKTPKGAPRSFRDSTARATLGDVWPQS